MASARKKHEANAATAPNESRERTAEEGNSRIRTRSDHDSDRQMYECRFLAAIEGLCANPEVSLHSERDDLDRNAEFIVEAAHAIARASIF
jgi:hypothetical protein